MLRNTKELWFLGILLFFFLLYPVYAADNDTDFNSTRTQVNQLQATDPQLPTGVSQPKGVIGDIIAKMFGNDGKIGTRFLSIFAPGSSTINPVFISGATITGLNASNLTLGTIPDARLSTNVILNSGNQSIGGIKTFTSTISGSISGNATTATRLITPRTIAGVSFNGTANIAIPFANIASRPTTISGYGITDALDTTTNQTIGGVKTFSSTISGSITGNAATATTLQTARTIAGVSFNGSANIAIPFANIATKPTTISGYGITDAVTLTGNQTIAGTKTFSSTISGSITGNAATATTLQTPRSIAGVSFNGSADIAIPFANIASKPTTIAGYGITDAVTTAGNQTIAGIKTFTNNPFLQNASPTTYFLDTDHRSAMIHVNSNQFYVLRGTGTGTTTWTSTNGRWPLQINLENNDATFGGAGDFLGTLKASGNISTESDFHAIAQNNWPAFVSRLYTDTTGYTPVFIGVTARGTELSPTYPLLNDSLAYFGGRDAIDGFTNTGALGGAAINIQAEENMSSTNKGTYMRFLTTNLGSTNPTEKLRIEANGDVGIGISNPTEKLSVSGSILVNGGGTFIGNGSTLTNLNASNITSGTLTGSVLPNTVVLTTGNQTIAGTKTFSSAIAGSITGNAATATALQTPRTIAGVLFSGTGNIDIPFANIASRPTTISGYGITDAVTTTGNQTIGGTKTFSSAIAGSITGNAATATALQNTRTINGVSFNGTSNITLPTVNTTGNQTIGGNKTFSNDIIVVGNVITDNLVNRTVSQLSVSGSLFPSLTSSQKDLGATGNRWANLWLSGNANVTGSITGGSFIGDGSTLTNLNASNITSGTLTGSVLPNTVVLTTGNQTIAGTKTFSSPIAGSITGNSATATALQTARNIGLVGDITGSASFNGSANISITGSLANNSVTTLKIADANVTLTKLAGNSVDSSKVVDGSITTADIGNYAVTAIKIATGAVTTTEILNGTIANVDISATATIAGTKISPNFGTQNVVTTGTLSSADAIINSGTDYSFLRMGQSTHDRIYADNSVAKSFGGGIWFRVNDTGTGYIDSVMLADTGNVGIGDTTPTEKLDVTGNIRASGTFIGDGSTLTNLNASNITSGTLTGAVLPNSVVLTSGNQTIAGIKTFSSPITASISGNAGSATALQTARTITLAGPVTGSLSFNGTTNVTLTGTLAANSIVTGNITDATILNADISASAAIAGTKIAPNFGTQNILTTGTIGGGAITGTNITGNSVSVNSGNITNTQENNWASHVAVTYSTPSPTQHSPFFVGLRARGTQAAPTYPQANDFLAAFGGRDAIDGVSNATNFGGAAIYMNADENMSLTNKGTRITFLTTNTGAQLPTEKMRLTSNGNVGIGTNNPTSKLQVVGNIVTNSGYIVIDGNGDSDYGYLTDGPGTGVGLAADASRVLNPDLYVNATGSVGIGTLSPTQKLDVTGNIRASGDIMATRICTSGGTGCVSLPLTATSIDGGGTANYGARFTDANTLGIGKIFDNGTNVGIGTTVPTEELTVSGSILVTGDSFINGIKIGKGAGNVSTNLAIGVNSLNVNTTGFANTALGSRALISNTTGNSNTALGSRALISNTTGNSNTAMGTDALDSNTTGNSNTAIGASSLTSNLSSANTAIGFNTLVYNASGSSNTAIGSNALYRTDFGSSNVVIGAQAAQWALDPFNNNVIIGTNAGFNQQSGSNNILIGQNVQATFNTGSNQLNIGYWIYGTNGDIGIADSTPSQKLDVTGNIRASGDIMASRICTSGGTGCITLPLTATTIDGGGTANYVTRFTDANTLGIGSIFDNGGNVGINTIPTGNLNSNSLAIGDGDTGLKQIADGVLTIFTNNGERARFSNIAAASIMTLTGDSNSINFNDTDHGNYIIHGNANSLEFIYDNNDNSTWDETNIHKIYMAGNSSGTSLGIGASTIGNLSINGLAIGDGDTGLKQISDGVLSIYNNNSESLRVNASGNVGIGNTNPYEKFTVGGNISSRSSIPAMYFQDSDRIGVSGNRGWWSMKLDNDDFSITSRGYDSDIGWNNEWNELELRGSEMRVRGDIRSGSNNSERIMGSTIIGRDNTSNATTGWINASMIFGNTNQLNIPVVTSNYSGNNYIIGRDNNLTYGGNSMIFGLANIVTSDNSFTIGSNLTNNIAGSIMIGNGSGSILVASNGNIGIGDTSPTYKLDVNGAMRSIGNTHLENASPTTYYMDTNNRSAMVHVNSNQFYVLRGAGTGSTSWSQYNGFWPLQINLENNDAAFGGNVGIGVLSPGAKLDVAGTTKLGTAGTAITNAGVCTTAAATVTTTAQALTCTGMPATTGASLHCNGTAAFTTPGTTSLYCRPNGTANSITCNTTVANAVSMAYRCMWMQ